ncbi:MAG: GNAT family N-acetyltransferase [Propionibacteriaceae bacterium]|jgi:predicted acetyltransferase|nr:GNAT family N-acetyltransferase [Propionibacteriaceae bacterium]
MSSIPAGYRVVELTADDWAEVEALDRWAAPEAADTVPDTPDGLPWERMTGFRDDKGRLAAVATAYDLAAFTLPGAQARTPGFTCMSVHPQDRRRGLLRAMMGLHFERALARGEALSVLTASETGIYGRFGYAVASWNYALTLPRHSPLAPPPGADREDLAVLIETVDPARHTPAVNHVLAGAAWSGGLTRPGWTPRTEAWTKRRLSHLDDQPADGYEPRRIMLVQRQAEPMAYAVFARNGHFSCHGGSASKVRLDETAALDAAASHLLWSRLLDLDLTSVVEAPLLAPNDPLFGLTLDLRGARAELHDGLWLRLLDVGRALAQRQYAADVDLVIELTDDHLPANQGRWRLRAKAFADGTEVSRSGAGADLACDVRALAAAYLGGASLAALAAAGQVVELVPGSLARASAAFAWPVPAGCNWIF